MLRTDLFSSPNEWIRSGDGSDGTGLLTEGGGMVAVGVPELTLLYTFISCK